MTTLTREALKDASKTVFFEVSAGGLIGKARKLKASQLSEYEAWLTDESGRINKSRWVNHRERLLGMCLVDEEGELLFPGSAWTEICELDGAIVKELFQQVEKGCGFSSSEAKPVKNSDEGSSETTD